ncbi:MAG: hypothetical protein Q8N81_05075 [bacterium]|nr:hypothetical protein [bacterium]
MKIGNLKDGVKILKIVVIYASLFVVVVILSYLTSPFSGKFYDSLFGSESFYLDVGSLFGLPVSYIIFLPLVFTIFGGKYKYWWTGILLLPVFILFFQADLAHIYFPIILGLAGWAIGYGLSRLLPKRAGKQN